MNKYKNSYIIRGISLYLALNIIGQLVAPTVALALTSGPTQIEMQSFEPSGTTDMVDLFTGDFNYNIPLFELPGPDGGYPFNLAYHSGVNMEQEASWVGLGWNINPGAITRDKRGLPDDFDGDVINTETAFADNITYGTGANGDIEFAGGDVGASEGPSIAAGLMVYNNSFKGIGYSFDVSCGFHNNLSQVGLGLSLDSQEGVGANADIATKIGGVDAGLSYNSISGATIKNSNLGSYSFSQRAYMPSFSQSLTGENLMLSFKMGGDLGTVFGNLNFSGFYRGETIKDEKIDYKAYGYNYLEDAGTADLMDFNREKDGIIRKESPNLPIPILTNDTYMALGQGFAGSYRGHRSDIGHFHDPKVESKLYGGSMSMELGLGTPMHIGLGSTYNETVMQSGDWTEDNNWTGTSGIYNFHNNSTCLQHNYEQIFYKLNGEKTSYDVSEKDFIGGETPVRADLNREGSFIDAYYNPIANKLIQASGSEKTVTAGYRNSEERIKRDASIQPITNGLLLQGSSELLPEYKLSYFSSLSMTNDHYTSSSNYSRSWPASHNAGFTCVNSEGARYVYALPTYNKTEEEFAHTINTQDYSGLNEAKNFISAQDLNSNPSYFRVTNSDKFKSYTKTENYAYGYLLTSVLGADYVDADNIPGPSDGDYGYWVKFNYVKAVDDYSWRSPYTDAVYIRGLNNRASDDKLGFAYGTKEVWYLASAETKSHIAVFKLSQRRDGMEATGKYVPGSGSFDHLYKLDEINLYTKEAYSVSGTPEPIKTVHFDYNYDLCGNVPNNDGASYIVNGQERNSNHGKLTLKKLWFTYQKSGRGSLSPYVFDYSERTSGGSIDLANNPNYNREGMDRWGNYKDVSTDFYKRPISTSITEGRNMPYVTQFDPQNDQTAAEKSSFKSMTDQNSSVYNMKSIGLPTGGTINVSYEADDYGYVQHRKATQMFQIIGLANTGDPTEVYSKESWSQSDLSQRKIYFNLENPIVNNAYDLQNFFNQYIAGLKQADGNYQMYFKVRSQLRDDIHENVSGYVNLNTSAYGFDTSKDKTIDGSTCHTVGYVTLNLISGNTTAFSGVGTIPYHPFAVAAWQFMRINEPELLTAYGDLGDAASGSTDMDKAMKAASLLSVFPAIAQVFTGYRAYAFDHSWGRHIDLNRSYIRLCSPDAVKIGGGIRVKKIEFKDNWNEMSSTERGNSYGQVYSYVTTEGEGADKRTISSGVAQYEPILGGDEIALRHAKQYLENLPLATDNNLFFEYPINEAYYPGPSVGYSKVTVQSLASAGIYSNTAPTTTINTTGQTVYEFYTAKDYPVIAEETDNQVRKFDLFIPIPLMGQINNNKLFATQGYSIQLNDMHGKLRKISNYGKSTTGDIVQIPISSVTYNYKHSVREYDGQPVNILNNEVNVITGESQDQTAPTSPTYLGMACNQKKAIMGEEYDFFMDSRKSHVFSIQAGLNINMEYQTTPYPLFLLIPWSSVNENTKNLQTLATNKVIRRAGILESTTATDGASIVTTENKLFDAKTGEALLTTVTNDYEKPIYSYSHPAHWDEEGMGMAAENDRYSYYVKTDGNPTGNTFKIHNSTTLPPTRNLTSGCTPINPATFYATVAEGDEVIVQNVTDNSAKVMATLIGKSPVYCELGYNLVYHTYNSTFISNLNDNDLLKMVIVRSGRRNLTNTNLGGITALKDPTDNSNRGVVNLSGSFSSGQLSSELAELLNNLLLLDNTTPIHSQLPFGVIDLSGGDYYASTGEALYPGLSSFFHTIEISTSMSGYTGCSVQGPQYFLKYTYIDENGECASGECHCLAAWGFGNNGEGQPGSYYDIQEFIPNSNGTITVVYNSSVSHPNTTFDITSCLNTGFNSHLTYLQDVITSSALKYRDAWDYDGQATAPSPTIDQTNLYALGKKGIWKPYLNYYYKDQRENKDLTANLKSNHDGVYKGTITGTNEFYLFNWNSTFSFPIPTQWLPNSLVVMYDENGKPIETKDINQIFSSVKYGYGKKLPVLQAAGARESESFYESFDDPSSTLYSSSNDNLPHSGLKSRNVTGNSNAINLGGLGTGKFTMSMWVASDGSQVADHGTNTNLWVDAAYSDGTTTTYSSHLVPTGKVIDGWQRIEGEITVPTGTTGISLRFHTYSGTGTAPTYHFDDIRVFPSKANIITSVYHPITYRLMAVLDANNFATFYHYDEEGKLFTVQKETIAGIKTIKEERTHLNE